MNWTWWGRTVLRGARRAWRSAARSGAGSVYRIDSPATSAPSSFRTLSALQHLGCGNSEACNKYLFTVVVLWEMHTFSEISEINYLALDRGTAVLLGTRGWIGVCASRPGL